VAVARGGERGFDLLDAVLADHVEMPCGVTPTGRGLRIDQLGEPRPLVVGARGAAACGPAVEVGKLHAEDRRLELVKA
jgi:hypothetical protein